MQGANVEEIVLTVESRDVPRGECGDAVSWVREKLGFEPDLMQARVLRSGARRGILLCTRQWGKSTVTAAKAVHHAMTHAGSLTFVVSPCGRQSGEFVRKAREFVGRLELRARGDGDNAMSVLFPNGSRIVGVPGDEGTIRGFSKVSLLLVDEASRVPDEMYSAVRPMLAVSGGALWLMSKAYSTMRHLRRADPSRPVSHATSRRRGGQSSGRRPGPKPGT